LSIEKQHYHIQAGRIWSNTELNGPKLPGMCRIENQCELKPFCEFRTIITEPITQNCPFYTLVKDV
jgi:hypothetical protein